MKHYLGPVFALLTFVHLTSASALAQTWEKEVIALGTDDFELAETDISTLAIGEAQTIETGSGKISARKRRRTQAYRDQERTGHGRLKL
jgi:hypothetical protein